MSKHNDKNSSEEFVIKYLKNNKNFFLKFPDLVNELSFSLINNESDKIINLDNYRYKKISQDNIDLQNQMTQILLAGKSHIKSQKRILKSSLKILNSKSLEKLINVILSDFKDILECDIINCFSTNNFITINEVQKIDSKIVKSYFKDKNLTNLSQNLKGILLYFPNKSKFIKSYIVLKIENGDYDFIIAMGAKDDKKFSPDQKVDLIEYLIKVIQIKLRNLK